MITNEQLKKVIQTAVAAGKKIIEIYERDFEIEYKADQSPLTEADKAANDIIVSFLRREFPEMAILSEEEKDNLARMENDWCWIVDPLDGTKEFVNRNGEFTVNIALAYKGQSVAGVIYVPVTKEIYYALKDDGAYYLQSEDIEKSEKIHVTDKTDKLIIVGSKSHQQQEFMDLVENNNEVISEVKSFGSSLKGCMVAKGEADIYYRFGLTSEWDTAAMQCIVEEAGGIMKQMDGSEMTYNRENNLNEKGFYIVNKKENVLIS